MAKLKQMRMIWISLARLSTKIKTADRQPKLLDSSLTKKKVDLFCLILFPYVTNDNVQAF